ncbi:hypothetical protein [Virgibacillus pantothenticus]|uniref:hypothetical protein n=1 Tax=Virgibacillus pantothenticus TaxID=1473 RepID=UPI0009850B4A|nr:hypothetical protein [Virgibacillus pantothenticus]
MKIQTAADLMEQFIEDGIYYEKKYVETKLKDNKKALKNILIASDMKRHEYKNLNMVAKFIPRMIYEWDEKGVIEYLIDYLVPEVYIDCLTIDHKKIASIKNWNEMSKPFRQKASNHIKLNFNTTGKQLLKIDLEDHQTKDEQKLLVEIKVLQKKNQFLVDDFHMLKEKMVQCNQLKEKRKLPCKYGSVSLVENKPTYDLHRLLDVFGESLFLDYGHVNKQQLNEFVQKGFIHKKEVEAFRTLKDIRLDFVVMSIESEQRMLEGMNRRNKYIQNNCS